MSEAGKLNVVLFAGKMNVDWLGGEMFEYWIKLMLNAAVRVAPYTASGTPLASFSAGRLVRRLTHTLTYDGGVPLHSLAGLRVNTGTVACGRGSSPAPYSPPSAETVAGGGEGLTLHTCEGGSFQPTSLKGGCTVFGKLICFKGHLVLLYALYQIL